MQIIHKRTSYVEDNTQIAVHWNVFSRWGRTAANSGWCEFSRTWPGIPRPVCTSQRHSLLRVCLYDDFGPKNGMEGDIRGKRANY